MTVEHHTLSNGLRIVTEVMPGLNSAAVGLWIAAGGRHERAEQNGIAHFLEHMAFKGTARRSAREIAEVIEDVGGYINAYTSREATAYYARVLEDDVPLALEVLSDIVRAPALAPSEIEIERGVILQEIGQVLDTPDDIVFDWLQETAYPGQALGRSILGPSERVAGFGRDDLWGFVRERYGADRIILSAAGAVDPQAILRAAERLLGDMPRSSAPAPEAARFQGGEMRVEKSLEQAHFTLAFEGPSYRDPEIQAAQVFATALGGGMSSRLFQELREVRGLCYSVFAQSAAFADTGLTMIYAGTSAEDLGELARVTMDEVRRLGETIDAAEIARARAQLKAGLLMGLESPAARAERLARLLEIWGRVPPVEETLAEIEAVDAAALARHAERLAAAAPAALTLYGPVAAAPSLDELRVRLAA